MSAHETKRAFKGWDAALAHRPVVDSVQPGDERGRSVPALFGALAFFACVVLGMILVVVAVQR